MLSADISASKISGMDHIDFGVILLFLLWICSDLHEIKKRLDKLEK